MGIILPRKKYVSQNGGKSLEGYYILLIFFYLIYLIYWWLLTINPYNHIRQPRVILSRVWMETRWRWGAIEDQSTAQWFLKTDIWTGALRMPSRNPSALVQIFELASKTFDLEHLALRCGHFQWSRWIYRFHSQCSGHHVTQGTNEPLEVIKFLFVTAQLNPTPFKLELQCIGPWSTTQPTPPTTWRPLPGHPAS